MADWRQALLELLLPSACFRCDRAGSAALCERCSRALPEAPPLSVPLPASAVAAGASYAGEVETWVRRFKYPAPGLNFDPAPEAILLALLVRAARDLPAPDLVLPIPLHPRRLRARGFNPAGRLARGLARSRGCDFDPMALVRRRDTPSQTGLDAAARRRNVAGAFESRCGARPRRAWLVDDVLTTGSTLAAAARALRDGGVEEVIVLTAAATPAAADGG